MYTIMMNSNKQLITTNKTTLYQRENLFDQIEFIYPQSYEKVNLRDCTVVMRYIDLGNISHYEVLVPDEELYKGHKLRATLPVTTNISRFAGDVSIRLFFVMKTNIGNHVLVSDVNTITILPVEGIKTSENIITELSTLSGNFKELQEEVYASTVKHTEISEDEINDIMNIIGI